MQRPAIPPFETFYLAYRDEILRHLRRLLGPDRADDAFQETFLRALRAYPRLEHGRHLRAWAYTIATRVASDLRERADGAVELPDVEIADEPLPFEELKRLTATLPPTERAAVVLRYGHDLTYAQIGLALGSSTEAARQAASSGVRRLRKELTAP